jgi:hypothetical protein
MDPIYLGGLAVALLSIVVSMVMDGNSPGALIGPSSFVLVLFGSLGATLMAYRKQHVALVPKSFLAALKGQPPDLGHVVDTLGPLADVARREGMLALEARIETIEDRFIGAASSSSSTASTPSRSSRPSRSRSPPSTSGIRCRSGSGRPSVATPRRSACSARSSG